MTIMLHEIGSCTPKHDLHIQIGRAGSLAKQCFDIVAWEHRDLC